MPGVPLMWAAMHAWAGQVAAATIERASLIVARAAKDEAACVGGLG